MTKEREALRVRVEYALWNGRKALHQPRLEILRGKYILEQDDVNRLERGIFSKWKWDYDEKLEKEQAEVNAAKAAWEKADALMQTADEKLPQLEREMEAHTAFWETADSSAFTGEEKILLHQCEQMERLLMLARQINLCILHLKEAQKGYADEAEGDTMYPALQREVDDVWNNARKLMGGLQSESVYDLTFLEDEPMSIRVAKAYPCRLTRSLAVFDVCDEMTRTHSAVYGMEEEMEQLREQLSEVFEGLAEEYEEIMKMLRRGESYF